MPNPCMRGITILEYLYGVLPTKRHAACAQHLATCINCRHELQHVQEVITSLDAAMGELVLLYLTELDAGGVPTYYVWSRMPARWIRNCGQADSPNGEFHMFNLPGMITDFLALQGEEVTLTSRPWREDPTRLEYVARLPRPVQPDESFDGMAVSHTADQSDRALEIGQGQWRFTTWLGLGSHCEAQCIVLGIRLPVGAQLVDVSPPAEKVTHHGITTVYWRFSPGPQMRVDIVVDYVVNDSKT